MRHLRLLIMVVIATIAGLAPSPAQADNPTDLLIIVNNGVGLASATAGDVKAIFLKSKTAIGGETLSPVNARSDSELREAFRKRVLKMSEDKERGFWEDEKVKKGVEPPPEVPVTLKTVASKTGAIGYVFRKDFKDGTAKVVATIAE